MDGDHVPAVLRLLIPPGLLLRHGFGIGYGWWSTLLVVFQCSSVNTPPGTSRGLTGISVDRDHAAGQHHAFDAVGAVDRVQDVAGCPPVLGGSVPLAHP